MYLICSFSFPSLRITILALRGDLYIPFILLPSSKMATPLSVTGTSLFFVPTRAHYGYMNGQRHDPRRMRGTGIDVFYIMPLHSHLCPDLCAHTWNASMYVRIPAVTSDATVMERL